MSNPKCDETFQKSIDENPFEGLLIDSDAILSDIKGRHPCPKCGKSRKYFCYTCYVPIAELECLLPTIKLPLKIDIIKHKQEIDGKSTAAHAAVLASEDVRIFTYPNIPNYQDEKNVVLIYPSFDSVHVSKLFNQHADEKVSSEVDYPKGYNKTTLMTKKSTNYTVKFQSKHTTLPVNRAVFIDSTWNQSKGIYKDIRVNSLRSVVLQNRISQFWRHQKGSPRWYLSTIEAIHQFLLEVHINMWGVNSEYKGVVSCFTDEFYLNNVSNGINLYDGQYDNLLFFFKHMYKLIHKYYDHDSLYAYKRRLL